MQKTDTRDLHCSNERRGAPALPSGAGCAEAAKRSTAIPSNGDIVIQNATANSMGDYVAPALDVISDLRNQGNSSLVGIYAYGISPKKYLDKTGDPFLDTIPTYVVDPDKIQQICSGAPITDIQNYSYGTASDITAKRLGLTPGEPIATIERTAFAMTGEAIEWRVASGRADRFRYRSRIG